MPFVKGDPRINRKGRPRTGLSLAELARELAEIRDVTLPDGKKIERKRALLERMWRDALSGNTAAQSNLIRLLDRHNLNNLNINAAGQYKINVEFVGDDADTEGV